MPQSLTIEDIAANITVQAPRIDLVKVLTKLQRSSFAHSTILTSRCAVAATLFIALSVACQAGTLRQEAFPLHAAESNTLLAVQQPLGGNDWAILIH